MALATTALPVPTVPSYAGVPPLAAAALTVAEVGFVTIAQAAIASLLSPWMVLDDTGASAFPMARVLSVGS